MAALGSCLLVCNSAPLVELLSYHFRGWICSFLNIHTLCCCSILQSGTISQNTSILVPPFYPGAKAYDIYLLNFKTEYHYQEFFSI